MKKILSILFVIITASSAVMAIDNPKSATGMAVMKSKTGFKLFYKGNKAQDVTVTIYNDRGIALFTEKIKNLESFIRPYNLNTLSNGVYTVEIVNAEGKLLQKVTYGQEEKSLVVDLLHVKNSNKYMLRVPSQGTKELTVKIYNHENVVVYEAKESVTGDFAKLYDVNKLGKDFYFEVSDDAGHVKAIAD